MKYSSQPACSSLSNYEQDDVIPASPGVTTYRSQKTKVPKQTKLYPQLDLKKNFIRGEIKAPGVCYQFSWLGVYNYNL